MNKINKWELRTRVDYFLSYFNSITEEQMQIETNKYIMSNSFCFKGEQGDIIINIVKEMQVYLTNTNFILNNQIYNLYIKDKVAFADLCK